MRENGEIGTVRHKRHIRVPGSKGGMPVGEAAKTISADLATDSSIRCGKWGKLPAQSYTRLLNGSSSVSRA